MIQIFNNPQFGEIRIATDENNEPLFCLSDLCKVLELNPSHVRSRLDDGVVSTEPIIDNLGRSQQANFVNEDGLYDVILDSRKPAARAFRKWVTSEVLPSIRKSGGYIKASVEETPEELMARALAVAKQTLERVERERQQLENTNESQRIQIDLQDKEIKKAAPKVEYYDKVMQSCCTLTTTQIANGLGMPCHVLNKKLKEAGIQYKQSGQWLLCTPYNNWQLHSVRTQTYTHADGSIGTSQYTVWSEKGKRFIIALYENGWNVRNALRKLSN